jgi:HSP20 family protein
MLPQVRRRRSWEPYDLFPRTFDRFFRRFWEEPSSELDVFGDYPVDIREEDHKIFVEAEMPGFAKDEINVDIDNDFLRITAERKTEDNKGTKHLTERRYTRYERAFNLPAPVDESKVDAKLDNGVLKLTMHQTGEKTRRRIQIK